VVIPIIPSKWPRCWLLASLHLGRVNWEVVYRKAEGWVKGLRGEKERKSSVT
jgi:hypothetical protein